VSAESELAAGAHQGQNDLGREFGFVVLAHGRDQIRGELDVVACVERRVLGEEGLQQEGSRAGLDLGLLAELAADLVEHVEEERETMLGRAESGGAVRPTEGRHVHEDAEIAAPGTLLHQLSRVLTDHEEHESRPVVRPPLPKIDDALLHRDRDAVSLDVDGGAVMSLVEHVLDHVVIAPHDLEIRVAIDVSRQHLERALELVTILLRDDQNPRPLGTPERMKDRHHEIANRFVIGVAGIDRELNRSERLHEFLHASP